MRALELVSYALPSLKPTDTAEDALKWMREFHTTQLPVVHLEHLLKIITEDDILNYNNPSSLMSDIPSSLDAYSVSPNEHVFEVVKKVQLYKLTIIPVVDQESKYLGSISINNLLNELALTTAINEPGGIIVLEINVRDYSLAEISRIAEGNNVSILSVFCNVVKDDVTRMEVTLKFNKPELQHIIASFERYNYVVKESYQGGDYNDVYKERFDALMNYLNV